MKKGIVVGLIVGIVFWSLAIGNSVFAQNFHIIPEPKEGGDSATKLIEKVGNTSGGENVIDNYNKVYKEIEGDIGMQMKTGILSRSTILDYITYLIRFLSWVGFLIGGVMVVYAGYLYGSNIFTGKAGDGKKALKNAIIGVLVIIFSYAIMQTLVSLFIS